MTLREIAFHDEVFHLYNSVGWSAYTKDRETLEKGFEQSLCKLGAYEDDELVGLVRLVGDGQTTFKQMMKIALETAISLESE